MRVIKVDGKVGHLTEKQHKRLVHRFNIQAVGQINKRPCICSDYDSCRRCPFMPFSSVGCIGLLRRLRMGYQELHLGWGISAKSQQGIAQAHAIRDWLMGLEKVDRRVK